MVTASRTFKTIMKEEFEERCKRNSHYSLRAFARDLQISPSRISEIFADKMGLSRNNALKIAKKLGYSDSEIEIFLALVESEHGRGKRIKEKAKERLTELKTDPAYNTIQLDTFKVISDWYHYAILELTYLKDFEYSASWISRRLGISETAAELALKRLIQLELLEEKNGTVLATEEFNASTSGIPSESLKKHHEQILDKAKSSVYGQTLDQRDLSAITLAIDSRRIPEAKELIKKFRREFNKLMTTSDQKDRVYCLAVQFFGLDDPTSNLSQSNNSVSSKPSHSRSSK